MHSATSCHPNKMQVNDGETQLISFKYLLASLLTVIHAVVLRLNFTPEWLADNSDRLTEKWRIFPCFAFEEKPFPYLK